MYYDEDQKVIASAMNKTIIAAYYDDAVVLRFDDGSAISISDDGQSCCENRYMTCDDDLNKLVGDKFLGVEVRGGESGDDDDGYTVHETEFVEVKTTGPGVTLVTHNEHNGYYGGFLIRVRVAE